MMPHCFVQSWVLLSLFSFGFWLGGVFLLLVCFLVWGFFVVLGLVFSVEQSTVNVT